MNRSMTLSFFVVFLSACTIAAAGSHVASAGKTAAADISPDRVDSPAISTEELSQVNRLYAQLLADYGYRPAIGPLDGFAQGAPALTPEAAVLALRNARSAVARLTSEIAALETLFADREKLSPSEFEKMRCEKLERIEALARGIRRDVYVDILGKLEGKTGETETRILPGQPTLQMRRLAEEMERGIDSYELSHSLQIVSVQDLRRPSLDSIAGAMIDLSASLRADRGAAFQTAE